jgi:superfamily II DNA or RNA helicase
MTDLQITKIDEVNFKVTCSDAIVEELSTFFTFRVPGAEFSPQFRKKYWDGNIRLFSKVTHTIYIGLFPYLKAFAKEREYSLIYDPMLDAADEFAAIEALEYMQNILKPYSASAKGTIECRDYQVMTFCYAIRDRRMLCVSPTSSGKSLIQYTIFRYLTEMKGCKKGLLIVPTTALVDQMYTDFEEYSTQNGYDVKKNCHTIYQGRPKDADVKLLISTWQSIYELPESYFEQFDFILGDEAHLFKAQSLTKIMTKSKNAKYRIGLTGTLDGTATHKLVLEGLFGRVRSFITTKKLQDRGQIADLTIKCLFLSYPEETARMVLDSKYQDELDFILAHKSRNNFIKNLTLSLKGNTLLLFQFVEKHGKILFELIEKEAVKTNRKCFFVFGGTETEQREYIRKLVNTEHDAIIIASYGTFSTGVNIPHLHNIIFTSPTKSRIRVLQSIGRGLRLGEFKTHCTLFDIIDDFSVGSATNTTLDHFQERFSFYVGEQFNYKFYNIFVKGDA